MSALHTGKNHAAGESVASVNAHGSMQLMHDKIHYHPHPERLQ
jgi:hypothetical protein